MGKQAKSIICFGVNFGADSLPWGDGDEKAWWRVVRNFELSEKAVTMANDGDYKKTVSEMTAWEKNNPMPISVVRWGYREEGFRILAIPTSITETDWSEARNINARVSTMPSTTPAAWTALLWGFLKTYNLKMTTSNPPAWYLVSYYG